MNRIVLAAALFGLIALGGFAQAASSKGAKKPVAANCDAATCETCLTACPNKPGLIGKDKACVNKCAKDNGCFLEIQESVPPVYSCRMPD